MLVLTRRKGEEIHIGDDIVIKVIRAGNSVRIGIDAPVGVKVRRSELAKADTVQTKSTKPKVDTHG